MLDILPQYAEDYQRLLDDYIGDRDFDWPQLPVYAWYFNERERIRKKREDHELPKPWTEDSIFANFRFTNVYRDDDRVSRALVNSMDMDAPGEILLFNAFVFRTFNKLESWKASGGFRYDWPGKDMFKRLDSYVAAGGSVFGNAYLMTNSLTKGRPKHHFYIDIFDKVWENSQEFYMRLQDDPRLEAATKMFTEIPGYADFLGYELALDMEMVGLMPPPTDKFTWANPGPGARRGLNFIRGRPRDFRQPVTKFLDEMRWLHDESILFLYEHIKEPFDMRCIENGLCETSKYASVLQTGRAKRRFR